MAMNERVHPTCVNASNPYHECGVACLGRIPPRKDKKHPHGSFLGFGKKRNVADSGPRSPPVSHIPSPVKPNNSTSPRSPLSNGKRTQSDDSRSSLSSHPQDHYFDQGFLPSSEIEMIDDPDSPTNDSITRFAFGTLAKQKANGKVSPSPKVVEEATTPVVKSMDFRFSEAAEKSDGLENSMSVVSDSYVAVGKYRVRPSLASTLQSVIDKHGDIAANSRLESASLRAHHLECLCSLFLELQTTPSKHLTKPKVKEMLAVLKDIESVEIEVSWLRQILSERSEVIDVNQYQAAEEGKAECLRLIESKKEELELLTEGLAQKEKEVVEIKMRIEDMRAHLEELELQSSQLTDTISSTELKLEKFYNKPIAEGIL